MLSAMFRPVCWLSRECSYGIYKQVLRFVWSSLWWHSPPTPPSCMFGLWHLTFPMDFGDPCVLFKPCIIASWCGVYRAKEQLGWLTTSMSFCGWNFQIWVWLHWLPDFSPHSSFFSNDILCMHRGHWHLFLTCKFKTFESKPSALCPIYPFTLPN